MICFRRCLFVCLLATLGKNFRTDLHEIFREGLQWPINKRLNFGGDPDHRLDTGIVFRIRHYWEIKKVVNGHKSAAHTDLPAQMAALTRRALEVVCTVLVLLVFFSINFIVAQSLTATLCGCLSQPIYISRES